VHTGEDGPLQRILITGGAGYIGSHTAKLLSRNGFEPIILDNLSTGNRWAVADYTFFQTDLADEDCTFRILSECKISAIIHFAASACIGESVQDPGKYFENNVSNGLKLLNAARRAGIHAIVFSSTCATYGVPRQLPIAEDHVQIPINPYGDSKLFVEKMLRWYDEAYGIRSVSLRYFNAAGADPEGDLGECHCPETHILPSIIEAATGQRPFIEVFGTDFETADGTAIRDYIHVTDLAHAHLLALRYLLSEGNSCAINLGTGHGVSVLQLIRAVENISKWRVPLRFRPRRPGDPMSLVASNAKAGSVLNWRPKHSDLDHIIKTAWQWHQANLPNRVPIIPYGVHRATAVGAR
jgi:UDP-glucose-4-epimerase GalE